MINLKHIDCMEYMKTCKDNEFELAIVDPPYGIGMDGGKIGFCGKMKRDNTTSLSLQSKHFKLKNWDVSTPNKEYFIELKRVSKNQIICGMNYFGLIGGAIFWDKCNGQSNFSDGEIIFQSFTKSVRIFKHKWHGFFQQDMKNKDIKIHPTQKPIRLYKWLLKNYAKENDKIFDSHLGSGSIAIACYDMNFDLVGCEIDKDYFDGATKRLQDHKNNLQIF